MDMLKDAPSDWKQLGAVSKQSPGGNQTCPKGTVPILRGPQDANADRKPGMIFGNMKQNRKGHEVRIRRCHDTALFT